MTELEKRDMTQKRLAELTGVSRATINCIKGGKHCTDEVGRKIAKAPGATIKSVLHWASNMRMYWIMSAWSGTGKNSGKMAMIQQHFEESSYGVHILYRDKNVRMIKNVLKFLRYA